MRRLPLIFVALVATTIACAQTAVVPAPPESVSIGSWGAAVFNWIMVILAPIIATALVGVLYKAFNWLGIRMQTQQLDRLQELVLHGINFASANMQSKLVGTLNVELKSAMQKQVLDYVKQHGMENLKQLGIDPNDPNFQSAIQARIERALNDPLAPTPPEWTPPEVLSLTKTRDGTESDIGMTGAATTSSGKRGKAS